MRSVQLILTISFLLGNEGILSSIEIASGFTKPVYVCQPTGEHERLFVLEQKGIINIIKNGKRVRKPFADLRDRIHNPIFTGDERGLLGLAFHPNYQENGFVFVNYTDEDDHTIVSRFNVSDDLKIQKKDLLN